MTTPHTPVLLDKVLELLAPKKGDSYLDLTAGYGGHAKAILEKTGVSDRVTLVDRDEMAIKALSDFKKGGAHVLHTDFLTAAQQLVNENETFDLILMDLGISSPHVDRAERGFSIAQDGPLDMRMDQSQSVTAEHIINSYSEQQLAHILREFGEEPRANRVAKAIKNNRPINTTGQLAEVVRTALPGPRQKVHPATKTFQAIRIAVNRELELLQKTLPLTLELAKPGAKIAVISFHSLEDRIVKNFFKEESSSGYESQVEMLTKKPIDGAKDDVSNPRARSAKLRAVLRKTSS